MNLSLSFLWITEFCLLILFYILIKGFCNIRITYLFKDGKKSPVTLPGPVAYWWGVGF